MKLITAIVRPEKLDAIREGAVDYLPKPADADHTEYLRVYMRQLRKKLEDDPERPQYILTEPGIGYRFIADE